MATKIRFVEIPVNNVVLHHDTQLFPFSPRREIDSLLVRQLKTSIAETGMWQPIVVRAGTMEGIAGNHRYLAYLEWAKEQGANLETLTIPTMLVDCDEGTAVTIGLIEDELREPLTWWEAVRSELKAFEQKPAVVEKVLQVDEQTARQLRLWEDELDREAEFRQRVQTLRQRLTREWLDLIDERLGEYPDLRAHFMSQLRHPAWVTAQTLDELDDAITKSLRRHGVRFEAGKTWNAGPAAQCLHGYGSFEGLLNGWCEGKKELRPRPDGTVPEFCPYLRLFLRCTQQFVPRADGPEVLKLEQDDAGAYPPQALTADGKAVRGETMLLIDGTDAYCIAPDVHEPGSCFHRQEALAAQAAVEALKKDGLPAVLPDVVEGRKNREEFVWKCPQREGASCTPETCCHAYDDPPGFVALVRPGDVWEMVCIHEECGPAAQEALIDWEKRKQQEEARRLQAAVDRLRQLSAARTLVAPPGKALDLTLRSLLEAIEPVLVPSWDTPTMYHVVRGWQAATQAQIAAELGVDDPADDQVIRAFCERYGELSQRPRDKTIVEAFAALRQLMTDSDAGLARWVACLALVRTWRDEIETIEQVETVIERVASYG